MSSCGSYSTKVAQKWEKLRDLTKDRSFRNEQFKSSSNPPWSKLLEDEIVGCPTSLRGSKKKELAEDLDSFPRMEGKKDNKIRPKYYII